MEVVNIHAAKTHLSRFLELLASGEEAEIIIAKAGKPVAKLIPFTPVMRPRQLGVLSGQVWEAPDAWSADTDAEIAASFLEDQDWDQDSLRVAEEPQG
jgi:antitoxin (DNA-binding transcriptional repressor) of toxin-antitoxin stability system